MQLRVKEYFEKIGLPTHSIEHGQFLECVGLELDGVTQLPA